MIFNSNKIWAKVWKVTHPDNGKYIDLQISTSEKNQDGEYVNSSWFPRVFGNAIESLKNVQEKDNILITKSKFTNERVETDNGWRSYFHFYIYEAEIEKKNPSGKSTNESAQKPVVSKSKALPKEEEDDCPW